MTDRMKAELVFSNPYQRFYKLTPAVSKVKCYGEVKTVKEAIAEDLPLYRKDTDFYKKLSEMDEMEFVCISDAHTHTERLAFIAAQYNHDVHGESYDRTRVQIDGEHTMMIHGGDPSAVYPDHVYLRRVASLNGMIFNRKDIIIKEEVQ